VRSSSFCALLLWGSDKQDWSCATITNGLVEIESERGVNLSYTIGPLYGDRIADYCRIGFGRLRCMLRSDTRPQILAGRGFHRLADVSLLVDQLLWRQVVVSSVKLAAVMVSIHFVLPIRCGRCSLSDFESHMLRHVLATLFLNACCITEVLTRQ